MQRLEISGAVRPLKGSLGVKGLNRKTVSGPQSASYLMGTGLLPWGEWGLNWWKQISSTPVEM